MLVICYILLILLLVLLVAMIRDRIKHPEDYPVPKKRRKRPKHRRHSKPPLTAWTWWMYDDMDSGHSSGSRRKLYFSKRRRFK